MRSGDGGASLQQMQHIVCPTNAKRFCANVDCAQVWQHATPKKGKKKSKGSTSRKIFGCQETGYAHTHRDTLATHTCHTETDKLCVFVVCKYIYIYRPVIHIYSKQTCCLSNIQKCTCGATKMQITEAAARATHRATLCVCVCVAQP